MTEAKIFINNIKETIRQRNCIDLYQLNNILGSDAYKQISKKMMKHSKKDLIYFLYDLNRDLEFYRKLYKQEYIDKVKEKEEDKKKNEIYKDFYMKWGQFQFKQYELEIEELEDDKQELEEKTNIYYQKLKNRKIEVEELELTNKRLQKQLDIYEEKLNNRQISLKKYKDFYIQFNKEYDEVKDLI